MNFVNFISTILFLEYGLGKCGKVRRKGRADKKMENESRDARSLAGRRVLITGITDAASLAAWAARGARQAGAELVCTGLGLTPHHQGLSDRAEAHMSSAFESFQQTVAEELGAETPTFACDLSLDGSVRDLAASLAEREMVLDGVLHAVAFDRTLRPGGKTSLLETSREDFLGCMDVSAYSLVALLRELIAAGVLADGAGVVALSYLGASRVVSHPYKNVGVAKAALERIAGELAAELGPAKGVRVNVVRFSPYSASRAGGAIPGLVEAEKRAADASPLGVAHPQALADEVVHLLRPGSAITGEIRHVDGGQNLLA